MTRVLVLAATTGYQIRSFGESARRLGVRLVFASDRCDRLEDPWWDQAIPIRFHEEATAVHTIREAFGASPPDGIVAVGDRPAVVAARVAEALGIPGHPVTAAVAARSKMLTREAFAGAGLLTPAFRAVSRHEAAGGIAPTIGYPAVVKPVALSGSRGVVRVNDTEEFVAAFERLGRLLDQPDIRAERDAAHDTLVVESFIPGRELAVEGLMTHGALRVLAMFDKPDPLDGPYFEETIYITPSRETEAMQRRIGEAVAAAATALGLRHGPVHAECRVNDEGVWVLEVAARPIGGLCSRALRFVGPALEAATLEDLLLRHAVGEDVSGYVLEPRASGVMMIPIPRRGVFRGVEGLEEARAVPGVDGLEITAKRDAVLVPAPEGRSYLGFIFASGPDPGQVEAALRTAHGRLRVAIKKEIAILAT